MSQWRFWNYEGDVPEDTSKPFNLSCAPKTDLWEKPPSVHSANAPCLIRDTTKASFVSAKVTVVAEWTQKYDQGGLVLLIHDNDSKAQKWVKTGIEFLNGQPQVSTVATYKWSDWSLRPMVSAASTSATFEIVSEADGSLWVYLLDAQGARSPIREVTWWGDLDDQVKVSIGVYAAKPDKDPTHLLVSFADLEIQTK